ncbi:hypothetical protein G3M48_009450 [Beauveria asiatica]|uniref:Heterokaryon incompatibility domain-containing protein n=1 Tax=Beauveria asiatica TaxID=1069075 RepID=A0AAW0S338_9HYPO
MAPFPSLFGDGLPMYKYTPIAPGARTFRLAKLLPPEPPLLPGLEPTVRISLIECSAGDGDGDGDGDTAASVEYDALSYAWDVPPNVKRPNRRIIVEAGDNGGGGGGARHHLFIYRPLELALLRFAAANGAQTGEGPMYELPLFIDQICIDQDNDDEKAQQVALMQAIYAHARRAVIWLGPGDAASDRWFAYVRDLCGEGVLGPVMALPAATLQRIYNAVVENPPSTLLGGDGDDDDPVEVQHRDDLAALTGRFASRYPIAPCLAVLRRSWFTRLWTIQEACLAPAAVIACGDALLCFDCFRAGMFFYTLQNNYWLYRIAGTLPREELALRAAVFEALEGFKRIFQERKAIHERRRRTPLHELVIKHNIVGADTAPRIRVSLAQDRIYGLMGLIAPDDPVKQQLRVYYNRRNQAAAQARAYTEAMSLFLQRGHMDLLLFTCGPNKTPGLPSWVPDWTMELALPVAWQDLHKPAFAAGGGPPYAGQVRFFDEAATAATATAAVTRKVAIKGVFIGRVAATGQATYTLSRRSGGHVHIKYDDAKLMFDEVDRLTREAQPAHHAAAAPSPETLTHTRLRVYDSGLSARHLTAQYSPAAGMERLLELQACIADVGGRILRSAAVARSFSLFNIYATVGITPWYVDYYSATTVLRRLARGPLHLARTVVLALADLLTDVVGLCAASARMWLATTRDKLVRRFARVDLRQRGDYLRSLGLDPDITGHADFLAFCTNIERNVGRRAFRTREGHVGMGPGETELGDAVVVLYGMTTPLVLRPVEAREEDDGEEEEWTVVGEAYCDGVMNGEALGVNEGEFVLI